MALTTSKPDFNITMPDVSASGLDLLDDITASTVWDETDLQYGFGTGSVLALDSEFRTMFHSMFGNAKPDQSFAFSSLAERSFTMIDSVATLDFAKTEDVTEVDLVLTSTDDKPRSTLEGFFQFPGNSTNDDTGEAWSIGAFNSALKAMIATPELGGGQYGGWTLLHEIGHSLGLKHTHREVKGLPPLASVGKYMDNERYSVMSYNGASDGLKYGHAVSMMALDVAALQALYGAETYATGASTYTLLNAKGGALDLTEGDVQIGRAYYCIWDSGGEDAIDYGSAGRSVLINLNDATLDTSGNSTELETLFSQIRATNFFDYMSKSLKSAIFDEWHNAGGFFSQVLGIKKGEFVATDGGYSIAHGAQIEDATGGAASDLLIGNELANTIAGNGGDDTILGAAGNDTLDGGDGKDWIDGGDGNDTLTGSAGDDIFVFSDGYDSDTITDFESGDVIDLRGLTGVVSLQDLIDNHMAQSGGDVVITVGTDVLTIKDVTIAELGTGDFAI
jgi:Ca2+-binding RTX toxin-like protein